MSGSHILANSASSAEEQQATERIGETDAVARMDGQPFRDADDDYDDEKIFSKLSTYLVGNVEEYGSSGVVKKCTDLKTGEPVAIKIQRTTYAEQELNMMMRLKALDPDEYNVVRLHECFAVKDNSFCMVYEWLNKNLRDFVEEKNGLTVEEIRPVLKQLLKALQGLKSISVIHNDIKLDNVLFAHHPEESFRVKLIDFGVGFPASMGYVCKRSWRRCFMSPEENLDLPNTEATDMWDLGMATAHMFLGMPLLAFCEEYDPQNPPAHLQNCDLYTEEFYAKHHKAWRFKVQVRNRLHDIDFKNWGQLKRILKPKNKLDYQDLKEFFNLLKTMLRADPERRITPAEALNHSFITMRHFRNAHPYMKEAYRLINCRPGKDMMFDSTYNFSISSSLYNIEDVDGSIAVMSHAHELIGGDGDVVHTGGSDEAPSADSSDIRGGEEIQLLKKSRSFFSDVFRMLSTPLKKIQDFFSGGFRTIFCSKCQMPRDNGSNVDNGHSDFDGASNHDLTSEGVGILGSWDVRDSDTRDVTKVKPMEMIRNLFSRAFRSLLTPLKKIRNFLTNRFRNTFCGRTSC